VNTPASPQNPTPVDPRSQHPAPPYPQPAIDPPGLDSEMRPAADHGEESYRGLGRLTDRRALITGGDSGIGRAVAIAFAREGADVAISYLPAEQSDAEETSRWVRQAERQCLLIPGDIQDETHCTMLVQRAIDDLGGLDILVNNAAFQTTHEHIAEWPTTELERTFRTNLFAPFWLCRAALMRMPKGAAIINTVSIQAFSPSPQLLAYASSKAALVNFTKALALGAAPHGIRVNAVAPGPVWTPLIPSTMPEDKVQTFGRDTTFGRAAQPVELAPLFVFLASNEARFATGEVYGATGGQTPY
jgi:NAD(P)-dependent dehydrogenase (short-subunit alcohol dehydrogenase family)